VRALIRKKETGDAIQEQLRQGDRVFVVQEIYTGKSFTLTSSNNTAIDVNVGGRGSVPDCQSATGQPGKTISTQPDVGASPNDAVTAPSNGRAKDENSKGNAPKPEAAKGQDGAANAKDASNQGDSIGVCRSNAYSLTFQSGTSLPFAVRLNEIESVQGTLRVKTGIFHFPPNTLGNAEVEEVTFVDPSNPVLTDVVRKE
jgi:hypothetical protein